MSNVLNENDAEKLVYSLKKSVKHDFEQILNAYTNKINEPVEILLIGNDPKFMQELIATFGRSKLIQVSALQGVSKKHIIWYSNKDC